MRPLIRSLVVGCSLALAACSADATDGGASASNDLVSNDVFENAAKVVASIDYLPFGFHQDGCTARSLYMAMELASRGQASNEVFAFMAPGVPLQGADGPWGFHVAPMLYVGSAYSSARSMVLDPSISATPIDVAGWVRKMGISQAPGGSTYPYIFTVPGSFLPAARPGEDFTKDDAEFKTLLPAGPLNDVGDFASMPAFKASRVQMACDLMHSFIQVEDRSGAPTPAKAAKSAKLVQRTRELVDNLAKRGKLTADATFDAARCAAAMPAGLAPNPAGFAPSGGGGG